MTDSDQLQRLVDQGSFEDVLQLVSPAEVARAWIRYQHTVHRDPGTNDPDWWAVEMWQESARWADEQRLRAGVLELVAAAEVDSDFGAIGAGVLEYFITDDEDRLHWLEERAQESEPFRRSLANVYVWGIQPDVVAARVEAAAGVRLPRPRKRTS